MAFKKIDTVVVSLGDQTGQVASVEGKLVEIQASSKYPDNSNYILEDKGKRFTVFGSAYINQRINPTFVGKRIRFEYKGMSSKSRAKIVDVFVEE